MDPRVPAYSGSAHSGTNPHIMGDEHEPVKQAEMGKG